MWVIVFVTAQDSPGHEMVFSWLAARRERDFHKTSTSWEWNTTLIVGLQNDPDSAVFEKKPWLTANYVPRPTAFTSCVCFFLKKTNFLILIWSSWCSNTIWPWLLCNNHGSWMTKDGVKNFKLEPSLLWFGVLCFPGSTAINQREMSIFHSIGFWKLLQIQSFMCRVVIRSTSLPVNVAAIISYHQMKWANTLEKSSV